MIGFCSPIAHFAEIVVGQESQILPAFIIGLDKAQSFHAWTQWHDSISNAELESHASTTHSLMNSTSNLTILSLKQAFNFGVAHEDESSEQRTIAENEFHSNKFVERDADKSYRMSDGFVVPLEDDAAENYQLLNDS
jgi:hypothetical protein